MTPYHRLRKQYAPTKVKPSNSFLSGCITLGGIVVFGLIGIGIGKLIVSFLKDTVTITIQQ